MTSTVRTAGKIHIPRTGEGGQEASDHLGLTYGSTGDHVLSMTSSKSHQNDSFCPSEQN